MSSFSLGLRLGLGLSKRILMAMAALCLSASPTLARERAASAGQVPKAVHEAVEKKHPNAPHFEVLVRDGAEHVELTFDAAGKLIQEERSPGKD